VGGKRTIGSQTQYNECQYPLHEPQHQDDEGLIEACHRVLLSVGFPFVLFLRRRCVLAGWDQVVAESSMRRRAERVGQARGAFWGLC